MLSDWRSFAALRMTARFRCPASRLKSALVSKQNEDASDHRLRLRALNRKPRDLLIVRRRGRGTIAAVFAAALSTLSALSTTAAATTLTAAATGAWGTVRLDEFLELVAGE